MNFMVLSGTRKKGIFALFLAIFLVAGCGDNSAGAKVFQTSLEVKDAAGVIKNEFLTGETITLELTITNMSGSPQTLTFTSSQSFDFLVGRDSGIVWDWAHGKAFLAVITEIKFQPLEVKKIQGVWDQKDNKGAQVPAGSYQAQGFMATAQEKQNLSSSAETSETRSPLISFTIR
jgi:hypothetical protein